MLPSLCPLAILEQCVRSLIWCYLIQVLTREEETVKKQLAGVSQSLSETCVESLVVIWRGICERLFSHYRTAVNAYFKYLRLHGKVMPCL
jgi:hypothetical protein